MALLDLVGYVVRFIFPILTIKNRGNVEKWLIFEFCGWAVKLTILQKQTRFVCVCELFFFGRRNNVGMYFIY